MSSVFFYCMMALGGFVGAWLAFGLRLSMTQNWVNKQIQDALSKESIELKKQIAINKSLKDTCEHSFHTIVNEQQDDQKIIVLECIKCGSISKDIIGRCNHEWEDTERITANSPYDVAIAPLLELAHDTFKSSKKSDKFDKIVDEVTDKWYKAHPTDGTFDQKIVRVKTCKKCGSIFVLDVSSSSLSSQLLGQPQEQQTTQE